MSKRFRPDPKVQALHQEGAPHPHPERVRDALFATNDFFDPRDVVQVKYEMLRQVRVEGWPPSQSARAFGFSRPSFYKARAAFEESGLPGLIPRSRGPRQPHKLKPEVMAFIGEALREDPTLRARALRPMIEQRFALKVHLRTIERALARLGKKRS